jgi:hypothetical protein
VEQCRGLAGVVDGEGGPDEAGADVEDRDRMP